MPWCHWFDSIGIDIRMIQYGTFTKSGKRVGARLGDPLCGIKYIMQNDEISDMTFSIMPLSITTFSIKDIIVTLSINGIQHNNTQHKKKKSLC
jgi:hypothetical protein